MENAKWVHRLFMSDVFIVFFYIFAEIPKEEVICAALPEGSR